MRPLLLVTALSAIAVPLQTQAQDVSGLYAGILAAPVNSQLSACCTMAPDAWQFSAVAGYQMSFWPVVAGIEGEASPMKIRSAIAANPLGLSGEWTLDNLIAVRGRFGLDVMGVVPFVMAGVVAGSGEFTLANAAKTQAFYAGWTAGAGVEVPVVLGLRLRADYQYSNFGNADIAPAAFDPFAAAFVTHQVKAGVVIGF